jgi:hypothetical protein
VTVHDQPLRRPYTHRERTPRSQPKVEPRRVLANPTVGYTAGTNTAKFDADDPAVWTASNAGFSFRYVVTYDSTTSVLIGYNDYGSTVTRGRHRCGRDVHLHLGRCEYGLFTTTAARSVGGHDMADGIYYRDTRQAFLIADSGILGRHLLPARPFLTQKTLTLTPQKGAAGDVATILPANYWTVGKTVKLTANLKWTAVANTNGVTIGMCYGAADAPAANVVATAVTPVSSTSTFSVFIQGYATCRSIGSSGTLSMWGVALAPAGLTTAGPITFPSRV